MRAYPSICAAEYSSDATVVSTPYSFSCQRMPRDNEDQLEAAMGAVKRMKAAHGMGYKTGRLCELLYK